LPTIVYHRPICLLVTIKSYIVSAELLLENFLLKVFVTPPLQDTAQFLRNREPEALKLIPDLGTIVFLLPSLEISRPEAFLLSHTRHLLRFYFRPFVNGISVFRSFLVVAQLQITQIPTTSSDGVYLTTFFGQPIGPLCRSHPLRDIYYCSDSCFDSRIPFPVDRFRFFWFRRPSIVPPSGTSTWHPSSSASCLFSLSFSLLFSPIFFLFKLF